MSAPNVPAPDTAGRAAPVPAGTAGTPLVTGRSAVVLVAALLVTVVSFQLNASMITPALPDMARQLGVTLTSIAQVNTVFYLAGSIGGIVLVRWSDYIGRRRVLMLVLGALLLGSLLAILAPNLPVLLVGRVLQGLSSATFQLSYLVLRESLTARTFGTVLGVITAVNGGVGGVDGYFGGLLTETFGFRSLFVVILAFGVVAVVAVLVAYPKGGKPTSSGRLDWFGAASLTIGLICLKYFITDVVDQKVGILAPQTLGWLVGTIVFLILFWWGQKRAASPLIAVEELRARHVWPVIAAVLLTLTGVFAVINFTVVVYSQNAEIGFGLNASTSALYFLAPPAIVGIAAAPLAGWFAARHGWILTLRIGLVVSVLAIVAMIVFPTSMWVVIVAVAVLGFSYNGLALTTLNGLGVLMSPKESAGALPAISGACFGLGASLGIGLVAPFASNGSVSGVVIALIISAGITVLALIASVLMRAPHGQKI